MKFKAEEIARFLNGSIMGNPDVCVDSVAKIEEGRTCSLAYLAKPKYEN